MAPLTSNAEPRQEFWRPAINDQRSREVDRVLAQDTCARCSADYPLGARFCHVCGDERSLDETRVHRVSRIGGVFDVAQIKALFGLTIGSLIAFFIGVICVIAAVATGLLFTATTLLDWQAVQTWRIEWLLGALVAFAAGLLFKR